MQFKKTHFAHRADLNFVLLHFVAKRKHVRISACSWLRFRLGALFLLRFFVLADVLAWNDVFERIRENASARHFLRLYWPPFGVKFDFVQLEDIKECFSSDLKCATRFLRATKAISNLAKKRMLFIELRRRGERNKTEIMRLNRVASEHMGLQLRRI